MGHKVGILSPASVYYGFQFAISDPQFVRQYAPEVAIIANDYDEEKCNDC